MPSPRDEEPSRSNARLRHALALIDKEDFAGGADEIAEIMPMLEGRDEIEALLGLGKASLWLEKTDQAFDVARRAIELSQRTGAEDLRGPALALLSQAHGQRGQEGDLADAVELGDRALEVWVPGTRESDLWAHQSLNALNHYWSGGFDQAVELARLGGDGATQGLALTALGRHQEALDVFDTAIAEQRAGDSMLMTAYTLNCSTAPLRDLLDLPEARLRNEEATELFQRIGFQSGVMQGEIDVLYADLLDDEVGNAELAWPGLWERARDATGWERWLAPGRLAVARCEIALRAGKHQEAIDAAREAIEIARRIGREKYEVSARITLGSALMEAGQESDAVSELRSAVEGADLLRHPPTRWQARAALARALDLSGDEDGAAVAAGEGAEIIRVFEATLEPSHAERILKDAQVQALLARTS